MSDLELLLEKVRTAEAGSRELDLEFWRLFDPKARDVEAAGKEPLPWLWMVTTSIDAIVALIARELPGWAKGFDAGPETCIAFIDRHDYSRRMFAARFHVTAATAPLALCAAFLAAKIHYQFRNKP